MNAWKLSLLKFSHVTSKLKRAFSDEGQKFVVHGSMGHRWSVGQYVCLQFMYLSDIAPWVTSWVHQFLSSCISFSVIIVFHAWQKQNHKKSKLTDQASLLLFSFLSRLFFNSVMIFWLLCISQGSLLGSVFSSFFHRFNHLPLISGFRDFFPFPNHI